MLMEELNSRSKSSVKLKGTGLWLLEGVVKMHSLGLPWWRSG